MTVGGVFPLYRTSGRIMAFGTSYTPRRRMDVESRTFETVQSLNHRHTTSIVFRSFWTATTIVIIIITWKRNNERGARSQPWLQDASRPLGQRAFLVANIYPGATTTTIEIYLIYTQCDRVSRNNKPRSPSCL